MFVGLTPRELSERLSFGKSPIEIIKFIAKEGIPQSQEEIAAGVVIAVLTRVSETILANNKRIEEQLTTAGIRLAD